MHGMAPGASTVRRQSASTIAVVFRIWASVSICRPLSCHSDTAAPVSTRSDCLGWKLAHVGAEDRSGFRKPPVHAPEPRSDRAATARLAATWSAALK